MRRYTEIETPVVSDGVEIPAASSDLVVSVFTELMSNPDNITLLYDVSEIHYSNLTKIDHPIAATIMESQNFPSKAEVTILDDYGVVLTHYCMRQKVFHFIQQKDNFHQLLLLLINQRVTQRVMINPPIVEVLTNDHFIEVNRWVIQYIDHLRYGEKKHDKI